MIDAGSRLRPGSHLDLGNQVAPHLVLSRRQLREQ